MLLQGFCEEKGAPEALANVRVGSALCLQKKIGVHRIEFNVRVLVEPTARVMRHDTIVPGFYGIPECMEFQIAFGEVVMTAVQGQVSRVCRCGMADRCQAAKQPTHGYLLLGG